MPYKDIVGAEYYEGINDNDGEYPAKSPVGMFESLYIPNDLGIVAQKMQEYYEGDGELCDYLSYGMDDVITRILIRKEK